MKTSTLRTAVLAGMVIGLAALGLAISSLAGKGGAYAYAQDGPEITPWPGCHCEEDGNVYCGETLADENSELCANDRDGDTIPDSLDLCPDEPGGTGWQSGTLPGCPEPDSDEDGFPNSQDICPETPGTVSGCPDSDGDGAPDNADACPETAGTINGCPDTDGDGAPDNVDRCPSVPGTRDGCPTDDRDEDGYPDEVDRCPDEPGGLFGCPPGAFGWPFSGTAGGTGTLVGVGVAALIAGGVGGYLIARRRK